MRTNSFMALMALVLAIHTGCFVSRVGCDYSSPMMIGATCGCESACTTPNSNCDGDQRCSTGLQQRLAGGGLLSRGAGRSHCGCASASGDGLRCSTWTGPLGLLSITRSSCCEDAVCPNGSGNGLLSGSSSMGRIGGSGPFAQDFGDSYDQGGFALAGGTLGSGAGLGCGRFGCGRNGRLCNNCRSLRGRNHPYGGQIPHTDPYTYGGWGGDVGTFGSGPVNYAYPYYTIRGPRDFLMNNPPSIGW